MARVLINNEWYNEISVDSLYESEFETLFKQEAGKIFPQFHTVEFKSKVESPYGIGKPDLALIDKRYFNWWVVEVEKSSHSLEAHVLKQVRVFTSATYNDEVANLLKLANKDLDLEKLKTMMRGKQPNVLVVVDTPKNEWLSSLKRYDALLCIFQIFRSFTNRHIYRLNGEIPQSYPETCCECFFDKIIRNYLTISSPALIHVENQKNIVINYKDAISVWKRVDISNKVFLVPISQNPLNSEKGYNLYKTTDNTYYITENN